MSESLEDRALRIWNEVHANGTKLPNVAEFARRLTAEQPAAEPVAWVIPGDDTAKVNGFIDAMCYQHGEFTRPLYAAPPAPAQDERDAKTAGEDDSLWPEMKSLRAAIG
ncbi:MAG: hypothetical protein KGJ13_09670, partial [Patescibacteria group bacterium]|nr:hypothetical protein [Patescibacteria group bacterium]